MEDKTLRIAIEGCCHGELDQIYSQIQSLPELPQLLIICGDFQSIRNQQDLDSIAVPDKYKKIGDFKEYYEGRKKAPILTVFIGGNHEASNYLQNLPYGGWVAENIFYMGHSNVIWYKGLRIGGISGIYKYFDLYKPHYEKSPFDDKSKRSVYHVRFQDFLKLSLIRNLNLNCFISHDWPEGIVKYGDLKWLLNKKPFFKKDIDSGHLGSVPAKLLLSKLMPHYWFSAHLHVRFEACVKHDIVKRKLSIVNDENVKRVKSEIVMNNDEISLDLDDEKEELLENEVQNKDEINLDLLNDETNDNEIELDLTDTNSDSTSTSKSFAKGFSQTNFLALDKCLPRRRFIEIIDIPITNIHPSCNSNELYYDSEFLKITKWFDKFQHTEVSKELRMNDVDDDLVTQFWKDIDQVSIGDDEDLVIPRNFEAVLENTERQSNEFSRNILKN